MSGVFIGDGVNNHGVFLGKRYGALYEETKTAWKLLYADSKTKFFETEKDKSIFENRVLYLPETTGSNRQKTCRCPNGEVWDISEIRHCGDTGACVNGTSIASPYARSEFSWMGKKRYVICEPLEGEDVPVSDRSGNPLWDPSKSAWRNPGTGFTDNLDRMDPTSMKYFVEKYGCGFELTFRNDTAKAPKKHGGGLCKCHDGQTYTATNATDYSHLYNYTEADVGNYMRLAQSKPESNLEISFNKYFELSGDYNPDADTITGIL